MISDRHASLQTAQFYTSLENLTVIDWGILQRRDFQRDSDDPEKTDCYQAEALVYRHLLAEHLIGVVCLRENEQRILEQQRDEVGLNIKVVARTD